VQNFAHQRFWFVPDFFDQNFLRTHVLIIRQNHFLASGIARSSIPK
jgi:hypothetical protein